MENRQKQALQKFINFVEFHQLEAKDIWEYEEKVSISQFLNKVEERTGKVLTVQESSLILELSPNEDQSLEIKHFEVLGLWIGQQHIHKEKKHQTNTVNKKLKKKISSRCLKNPITVTKKSQTSQDYFRGQTSSDFLSDALSSENEKNSVLQAHQKMKRCEDDLQAQIVQNSLDKKWDYLLKVGEMNNWLKNQQNMCGNNTLTNSQAFEEKQNPNEQETALFKVYGDENEIVIISKNEEGEQRVLPLRVFDQKYQSFRKKFAEEEKPKNNMKGTMMMVLDDSRERFCKNKLHEKIALRDQELNYLLLEIIRSKNMMEQQERVLTECGVNQ